jgi:transcriptional regulator with XRE-family HTH domain
MTTAPVEPALSISAIASARIRGLRAERGWNQSELALRVGLSRVNVSDRESGRKAVNIDELPAFADALGSSVAYLMGLTNDRSRPLEEAASGALRACRDSNPKPSDLSTATARAALAWGLDFDDVIGQDEPQLSGRVLRFPLERTERLA